MWLPIPGFEEYLCSEEGLIKPISGKNKNKILSGSIFKSGYKYVSLRDHNYRLSRIVGITFLPQPTEPIETLQIDHIDRNKLNNQASNLRWVCCSENNKNKNPRGIIVEPQSNNKLGERYICLNQGYYRLKMKRFNELSHHKTFEEALSRKLELLN